MLLVDDHPPLRAGIRMLLELTVDVHRYLAVQAVVPANGLIMLLDNPQLNFIDVTPQLVRNRIA